MEGWEYCRPRFFFEWPRRQLPKYRSPQPSVHNGPANCVVRRRRQTGATATAVLARAALCSGLRRRAQSDRSIRRGQQQQEECPVSFVIGSGSAVFAALHDHVPFGCTDAPVPFSAAPLQDHFKDWKSTTRHGDRDKRTSSGKHHLSGRWECHHIFMLGRRRPSLGDMFGHQGI